MKRCPTCNQPYADETMSFCLTDGAPLILDTGPSQNAQATLVFPGAQNTSPQASPQTSPLYSQQPPPSWQPPAQQFIMNQPRKSSALPWVIGGLALLFVLGGLATVVALFVISGSGPNRADANRDAPSNNSKPDNRSTAKSSAIGNNSNNSAGTDYSERAGSYAGQAINTTNNPPARGRAEIELTEINNDTGYMRMQMSFSSDLCGDGDASGTINKGSGEADLYGSLGCSGLDWAMAMRCTFPSTDSLNCVYRLTASGQTPQTGYFRVTK